MMGATEPTPAIEPLLSVSDVALILGLSRATVYTLVKDGKIVPLDLGIRRKRFRRADIAAFIGEV